MFMFHIFVSCVSHFHIHISYTVPCLCHVQIARFHKLRSPLNFIPGWHALYIGINVALLINDNGFHAILHKIHS